MIKIVTMTTMMLLFGFPFSGWCNYVSLTTDLEKYSPPPMSQLFPSTDRETQKIRGADDSLGPHEKAGTQAIPPSSHGTTGGSAGVQAQPAGEAAGPGETLSGILKKSSGFFVIPPPLARTLSGVDRDEKKAVALLKKQISPDLLSAMALLRNPAIARARELVDAESAAYTQVADLDLVLGQYAAFTRGVMNGVGPVRGRSSIEMEFPFPGVTALKGQVVAQSVAGANEALALAERNAVIDVQKAFWDRVYLIRAREITRETLAVFKNLHGVADSLYRSGRTGFQDVTRVTVKVDILEETLLTLQEKQQNADSLILSLLNLPPETVLGPPVQLTPSFAVPDIATLYTRAQQDRQELRQIRAGIGKMERMVELAETMILPGFDLGFSRYGEGAVMQVGSLAGAPSFAETIPASMGKGLPKKPWYGTGASWLMETRKRLAAKREALRSMEADTRKMVRKAWYELDRAVRRSKLYGEKVVALSATALDVSTREYEAGRISFADVAGAYSDWLQARLGHARAVSDIGISRAQLARVTGTGGGYE